MLTLHIKNYWNWAKITERYKYCCVRISNFSHYEKHGVVGMLFYLTLITFVNSG